MKVKSTKKSLICSITSFIVCISMFLGTTYAWFTDSVTSGTNKIIAGNLDIELTHTNSNVTDKTVESATNIFAIDMWEPGAMAYETFTVKNAGTLALKYNLALTVSDYNAIKDTDKTLKDVLKVKILTEDDIIASPTRALVSGLDWTDSSSIDDFKKDNGKLYPAGTQGKDSTEEFQVIIYWEPSNSDNDYNLVNGKTTTDGKALFIEFGVNVVATQLDFESDSFGDDYDSTTIIPSLPTSINKTFETSAITTFKDGSAVEIDESIVVKNKNTNTGVATLQKESVKEIVDSLVAEATDKKNDSDLNTIIYVDVKTEEKNENSATYDITMSAVLKYTNTSNVQVEQTLNNVDTALLQADKIVVVELDVGAGLKNVKVSHSGIPMTELASASATTEGFFYNSSTGKITINSKSFSPFKVDYDLPKAEVKATDANGNTYGTSLEAIRDAVNQGNTLAGWTITQISDIDISQSSWTPIGVSNYTETSSSSNFRVFSGTYDGGNYTIKGLTSAGYVPNSSNVIQGEASFGLFGRVKGATIKNVKLTDVNITDFTCGVGVTGGAALVGCVCDDGDVTIENCHVLSGTINCVNNISGILGFISYPDCNIANNTYSVTIKNCSNAANITTTKDAAGIVMVNGYPQGITGYDNYIRKINIENCTNKGNITSTDKYSQCFIAGILVQQVAGNVYWPENLPITIKDCTNNGKISGYGTNGDRMVAGIMTSQYNFDCYTDLINCTNTGEVEFTGIGGNYVGDIISFCGFATVRNCTSTSGGKLVGECYQRLIIDTEENRQKCNTIHGQTLVLNQENAKNIVLPTGNAIVAGDDPELIPVLDGYTFEGWYTAITDGTKVTDLYHNGNYFQNWDGHLAYAVWTKND